jgi:GT2 family glycosyltransferase
MVDLSVIIVSYNTRELLKECLQSIYKNTKDISYEIFVVDNNSTDQTVQMVKENFQEVKLIENKENRGFAGANNQALKQSRGRNVLLLNSDTKVLQDSLNKMVAFIDGRQDVSAVGCRLLNTDMSLQPSCYRFPSLMPIIAHIFHLWIFPGLKRSFLLTSLEMQKYDRIHKVDGVRGACLLAKRSVLSRVGYLDEDYFMYAEEIDWCYRMKKAGLNVYYFPNSKIIHYRGQSTDEGSPEILIQRVKSLRLFYKKNFGTLKTVLFSSLKLVDISIKIAERMIANIFRRLRKQKAKPVSHYWELEKWLIRHLRN